ncbi:kirola-like protein [Tanacetum coccineum]
MVRQVTFRASFLLARAFQTCPAVESRVKSVITCDHYYEELKSFIVHLQVETKGSNNLVTWTLDYEKLSPDVPDPVEFMDLYTRVTKDIVANHP